MSDDDSIQRSRLAARVQQRWGSERVRANEAVIASASQAIARIERLIPAATIHLDAGQQDDDDERD
jgi:hypothetical protein